MDDLERMQGEIAEKLEHGFDTRHIYQMFSSFMDTIKNQSDQINEMQEHAERSELLIENMNHTIRTMEMNIQGFVTLEAVEDDDGTFQASRRPSISSRRPSVSSRRPSLQPRAIQNGNIDDPPKSHPDSTASGTTSPRGRPNEWENSPDKSSVTPDKSSAKDTTTTEAISEKPRRKSKGSSAAWKYKKRRIMRQVSNKLLEQDEDNMISGKEEGPPAKKKKEGVLDDDSAVLREPSIDEETALQNETTHTEEDTEVDHEPVVHDTVVDQNISSDKQTESVSEKDSENHQDTADTQPKSEKSSRENSSKPPRSKRSSHEPDHMSPRPPVHRNLSDEGHEKSTSRPSSKPNSRPHTRPNSSDMHRGYDEVPFVDPTQTVVYRITALEDRMAEMAALIASQKNTLEVQRLALESGHGKGGSHEQPSESPTDTGFEFFGDDSFVEDVTVTSNNIKDIEDEEVDDDINVRDEDTDRLPQQDDVKTKTRVVETPDSVPALVSVPVTNQEGKQGSSRSRRSTNEHQVIAPYDDTQVVKFNDQQELPPNSAAIISKQVCGSEPMKKLLERVVKSTEKMLDQGLKRIPKPPVQITANDMLTDSIVAILAQSMLKRGLLDDLRYNESTPRDYSSAPSNQPVPMRLPTPTATQSSPTNGVDMKAISDSIVSKQEILDMIKEQIKRIPPPPAGLAPAPAFEFAQFQDKTAPKSSSGHGKVPSHQPEEERDSVLQPRQYHEMDDDSITVGTQQDLLSPRALSSPRASVRETTMGERARSVLEQHVETIEHDKASTAQLDGLSRNMSTYISMEVARIATHYEGLFDQFSSGLQGRQDGNEKSIVDLRHAINDLEAHMNNQMQHTSHKPSSKKKEEEGWKSDLLKVSQSVIKAREDQRTVAKMLVEELENLQNQMKNRVDESRLEDLAHKIEEKVQKEMGESVSGINLSMAKIISAVRNKTDRNETEILIQTRLHEAEESLRILQDDEPAGAFKCISCGVAGKKMTPNMSLESLSFASAIMSQSVEVKRNKGGDYDQTAAVLNRQAGLRPVSRQQKPMTPKTFTPSSAPSREMTQPQHQQQALEPLYRRAKHANQVREIPKIPNITFGVGNQNQYRMDDRPDSSYLPKLGSHTAPISNTGAL